MEHEVIDPHLNLFRRYGLPVGAQEYENNVTHALVNTLRLSDPRVTRLMLTGLVPEIRSLTVDWSDIGWGLQRPPRSPSAFRHRLMLAISPSGYVPGQASNEPRVESTDTATPGTTTDDADDESEAASRGVPDAWIYTKSSPELCISMEVKVRGGIDPQQIRRHERTHFGELGVTLRQLDLGWRELSRELHRASYEHPNSVLAEFLSFLSAEGLAATLRFDTPTIQRANGQLPEDVMVELVDRLRRELRLATADIVRGISWVLIFRDFEAVGNIEVYLEGVPPDTYVRTLLSFGTAKAWPQLNRITMPDQIVRLLETLGTEDVQRSFIEAAKATGRPLSWSVYDRLQRAQHPDWSGRNADEITAILRTAGRDVPADAATCFGDDQEISFDELGRVRRGLSLLHRAGVIPSGAFRGYSIFARAYLYELRVPAYDRSPLDVLPQVVEHCVNWYRILRILSGVE